ncbi:hypothetical protein [Nocardia sp. NPDC057353]|uniref:hypothetical protein n=1 Tax=Nocardia sp. NPDC057353 TaxID=3346104 RepID=UPI00363CF19B
MSAPAIEATMPAQAAERVPGPRPAAPRPALRTACTVTLAKTAPKRAAVPVAGASESGELAERLTAANQRAAELEERLAAVVAERDAAEHQAALLEDRNRELACDLDNALDQLAGHALHAEQERLVGAPAWHEQDSWLASDHSRGGFSR